MSEADKKAGLEALKKKHKVKKAMKLLEGLCACLVVCWISFVMQFRFTHLFFLYHRWME